MKPKRPRPCAKTASARRWVTRPLWPIPPWPVTATTKFLSLSNARKTPDMEIASLTIDQIKTGLAERKFSATEIATEALRFAEAENPKTNALLRFSPERAMAAAKKVDEQ